MVGSKNFEESRLLAEMFARVIEARTGLEVERRFNFAGTDLCLEALRSGAIDLYPEYTGTGLVSIWECLRTEMHRVLNTVRREFLSRWDLVWTGPLGFENAYEIGLRKDIADAERIRTISDLAAHAPDLRAAFGIEFLNRPDGLPGLSETYGLQFADVKTMQQHLKYEAAGAKAVDVIDVYTTDGHILKYGLVVLEDDRDFFPPYEAAPLVRRATLEAHPGVGVALDLLAGVLDEDHMRRWNLALRSRRSRSSRPPRARWRSWAWSRTRKRPW
ncbi:MAG: glycine betaine ABC transporter substrate-binding protein [Candidatus Eisenbacteria bacterium]